MKIKTVAIKTLAAGFDEHSNRWAYLSKKGFIIPLHGLSAREALFNNDTGPIKYLSCSNKRVLRALLYPRRRFTFSYIFEDRVGKVTVEHNDCYEAEIKARNKLDKFIVKRGKEPPALWNLELINLETLSHKAILSKKKKKRIKNFL